MSITESCFNICYTLDKGLKIASKARSVRRHFSEIREIIVNPEKRTTLLPGLVLSIGAVFVEKAFNEYLETKKVSDFSIITISVVIAVVAAQTFILFGQAKSQPWRRKAVIEQDADPIPFGNASVEPPSQSTRIQSSPSQVSNK